MISKNKINKKILHSMSITTKDVEDDFRESISKTNDNGLPQNVWARRSDDLEKQFKDTTDIKVLHIKRTKLWQIDPVFDKSRGNLYLLFSDTNLNQIRRKYINKGASKHYSVSFLLKNEGILPKKEEIHLIPFTEKELSIEKDRRQKDVQQMLGDDAEKVKKVIIISVTYNDDEAIAAENLIFNFNFEICEQEDISDLLEISFNGDTNMNERTKQSSESNKELVTLKSKKKEKRKISE